MYEYKATVVGPLNRLRPGQRKVEEVGVSLADAYESALAHYSRQGYRLHSVAHIEGALVLFVFEKEVLGITSTQYNISNNVHYCQEVDPDIPVTRARKGDPDA